MPARYYSVTCSVCVRHSTSKPLVLESTHSQEVPDAVYQEVSKAVAVQDKNQLARAGVDRKKTHGPWLFGPTRRYILSRFGL